VRASMRSFLNYSLMRMSLCVLQVLQACSRGLPQHSAHMLNRNGYTIIICKACHPTLLLRQDTPPTNTDMRSTWLSRLLRTLWMSENTGNRSEESGADGRVMMSTSSIPDSDKHTGAL